ncbi:hypothetical protein QTP88_018001 [Uroleucon formosanum]
MKTVADYARTPNREQRHGRSYRPLGPLFRFRLYCYRCSEAGKRPCALETSAVPVVGRGESFDCSAGGATTRGYTAAAALAWTARGYGGEPGPGVQFHNRRAAEPVGG